MSAGIVSVTVRLTVQGSLGRVDLAVPTWSEVGTVARAYADTVGLAATPALTTSAGASLDPATPVDEAGLRHGDVLVALDADAPAGGRRRADVRGRRTPGGAGEAWLLLVASVCALGGAAVLAVSGTDGPVRVVSLVLLLVSALVTALPLGVVPPSTARARSAASPAFAAAAGFAVAYSDAAGGLLLGLAVAALAAAVFAAVGRAFLDPDHDELVEVWLVVAGSLAVVTVALLLLGGSMTGLLALVFGVAVVAARLLPYTVVDVPDEALLDLDRLAVTAWSAREQPRGSRRRRSMVRMEGVTAVVHRGKRLVAAGTIVISAVVALAGPVLVLGADDDLAGTSALVMVGLGGGGLALVARSFRSTLPRLALRLSAAWVVGVVGLEVLRRFGSTADWVTFAAGLAVALLVTVTAVSLGRGWRSVWWARVADIVEGLAVVLVLAAVPLASGLFAAVRGFTA